MKALSIHPYFAQAIIAGQKTIEVRSWSTDYRGDILICSTQKKYHGTIPGHALGIVELVNVREMTKDDCSAALLDKSDFQKGLFAWELSYNRLIKPIPCKGKLSLWTFEDDEKIEIIPDEEWILPPGVSPEDAPAGDWVQKYWEPLMI